MAITGSRIAAVGPYEKLVAAYPDYPQIGSDQHLVLPGLINSHHHGWGLSPFQLGARDRRLEPWLIDLLALRPVDPYLDAMHAAIRLVRSGVTTVQHAGFPREPGRFVDETRAALRAYEDLGLRVTFGVPIQDRHSFVYRNDDEFLDSVPADIARAARSALAEIGMPGFSEFRRLVDELRSDYADNPLISLALSPQGPEWCSEDLLMQVWELAREKEMLIHTHCLESPHQREFMEREKGRPIVEWLDDIGFLGPNVSFAHAVWLQRKEIELCAERGVSVCHNPSSNIRLCVGVLPFRPIAAAGVNVALGMDSTTLNEDDDMLKEVRLAAKFHGLPSGLEITSPPSALEVLAMATVNGARALGLAQQIGTLEEGRRADATLLDYERLVSPYADARLQPHEVVVQRACNEHVDAVVVNGRLVVENGEPTQVDRHEIAAALARSAREEIEPRTRAWIESLQGLRPHVAEYYEGWAEPALRSTYVLNSPG